MRVACELPGLDPDEIDARGHNGLPALRLPKSEEAKATRIAVKSG